MRMRPNRQVYGLGPDGSDGLSSEVNMSSCRCTSRCLSGQLSPVRYERIAPLLLQREARLRACQCRQGGWDKSTLIVYRLPVEGANHKRTALSQINQLEMCFGPRGHAEGPCCRSLRTTDISEQFLPHPTRSALSDRRCSLVVGSSPSKPRALPDFASSSPCLPHLKFQTPVFLLHYESQLAYPPLFASWSHQHHGSPSWINRPRGHHSRRDPLGSTPSRASRSRPGLPRRQLRRRGLPPRDAQRRRHRPAVSGHCPDRDDLHAQRHQSPRPQSPPTM